MPGLDLRDGPAASVYGLLRTGRFVLLARPGTDVPGPGKHADIVRAEIVTDDPAWADAGPLLIRPDGHLATAGSTGLT